MKDSFEIKPIGFVKKKDNKVWLEIKEDYKEGLLCLDEFSHVITIWWISGKDNKVDRAILQGNPQIKDGDKKLGVETPICGVFATRAPMRPNPLGLTIVKILEIIDNKIYIDRHDAFDNTPVIDLKPYIPKSDSIVNVKIPDFFAMLREKRIE